MFWKGAVDVAGAGNEKYIDAEQGECLFSMNKNRSTNTFLNFQEKKSLCAPPSRVNFLHHLKFFSAASPKGNEFPVRFIGCVETTWTFSQLWRWKLA